MQRRRHSSTRRWYLYVVAAGAAAIIVLAITQIGPPTSSARVSREVVQAENGVVQSTVSGTGNVEPITDEDVDFATSGTLQDVYVHVGQHVDKGQLLATLDPGSAKLALKEAKANLAVARDNLKSAQDGSSSSSDSGSTSTSLDDVSGDVDFVGYTTTTTTTPTTTTPTTTTPTTTTPTTTTPTTGSKSRSKDRTKQRTSATGTTTTGASTTGTTSQGATTTGASTTGTTTTSASEIASAKVAVDTDKASVEAAKQALSETKLYAPVSGTIASLQSVSPGQSITSSSSNSSSSTTDTTSSSSSTEAGSLGSSSSSSDSSSSAFAEIINSSTLTMTVAFSESDISQVKVGQPATVSMDALSGVELGAHVTSISPLATTSDDVVSYDVTLTLDQNDAKVRPGMSASASVITAQAQGVTVPTEALSGTGSDASVEVEENGKTVTKQVVVGLRGTDRAVILSGVRAGQDVVVTITLPALGSSTTSSSSSSTGTLGSGLARRSFFGGGGFGGAGGLAGSAPGGG